MGRGRTIAFGVAAGGVLGILAGIASPETRSQHPSIAIPTIVMMTVSGAIGGAMLGFAYTFLQVKNGCPRSRIISVVSSVASLDWH